MKKTKSYSEDYHDPDKRTIANAMQIFFKDGTSTDKIEIEYPIGHKRRRDEGIPVLQAKFERNVKTRFPENQANEIVALCNDKNYFEEMPVNEFMDLLVI